MFRDANFTGLRSVHMPATYPSGRYIKRAATQDYWLLGFRIDGASANLTPQFSKGPVT